MLVSNFYYILEGGLSVSFKNTSSGGPSSFSWDFGDGSTPSTDENPTHDYSSEMPFGGWVVVKLTISKDGESNSVKEVRLGISPTTQALPTPIRVFVNELLTPTVVPDTIFSTLLTKWQIYLRNFAKVDIREFNNELVWPALYNQLIAYLIILDVIVNSQLNYAASIAGSSGETQSSGGSSNAGGLKSVVTGPSEAEWYDLSESWKNLFSTWSSGGDSVAMGFYKNILNQMCVIVGYLDIPLLLCPTSKKKSIVVPKVGYMPYVHLALDNYLLSNEQPS